jgi:hypothetical protein
LAAWWIEFSLKYFLCKEDERLGWRRSFLACSVLCDFSCCLGWDFSLMHGSEESGAVWCDMALHAAALNQGHGGTVK